MFVKSVIVISIYRLIVIKLFFNSTCSYEVNNRTEKSRPMINNSIDSGILLNQSTKNNWNRLTTKKINTSMTKYLKLTNFKQHFCVIFWCGSNYLSFIRNNLNRKVLELLVITKCIWYKIQSLTLWFIDFLKYLV